MADTLERPNMKAPEASSKCLSVEVGYKGSTLITTTRTSSSPTAGSSSSSITFDCETNGTSTPPPSTEATPSKTQAPLVNRTAEDLIGRLTYIHAGLTELYPNIQPGEKTNVLFSEMVRLCIVPYNEATCSAVLNDQRITRIISDLRKYSAEGEGMLEQYWARIMLESPRVDSSHSSRPSDGRRNSGVFGRLASPVSRKSQLQASTAENQDITDYTAAITLLKQFPYYQNYVDLARLELNAIMSVSSPTEPPRKWAFLGSGPMPLTAICLAQLLDPLPSAPSPSHSKQPSWPWAHSGPKRPRTPTITAKQDSDSSVQIHNIDRCQIAISLSSQLCQKLGRLARCLTFECTEASDETDLASFDVVYLAALVGTEAKEKFAIIASVAKRMRQGALLVMRSAHGMRQVLYPVVEPAGMIQLDGSGVVPLVVVHPWNDVVNSVVVAKVVRC